MPSGGSGKGHLAGAVSQRLGRAGGKRVRKKMSPSHLDVPKQRTGCREGDQAGHGSEAQCSWLQDACAPQHGSEMG